MDNWIWFDMDGTLADFYGVSGWLNDLQMEDVRPYAEALPLLQMSQLARMLHKLQKNGYQIGIISWLSKSGSPTYKEAVSRTKMKWLTAHLPSVEWDAIKIVDYGTNKWNLCQCGILFDDEQKNRDSWLGNSYEPK